MYVYVDVFAKNNRLFAHIEQFLAAAVCTHVWTKHYG